MGERGWIPSWLGQDTSLPIPSKSVTLAVPWERAEWGWGLAKGEGTQKPPKKSLAGSWCHPEHGNRATEGSWTSRYSQKNRQCILKTPPETNHLTLERTKVRREWAAFNSSTVIAENIRKTPQMGWRRSSPEWHSGKLHKEYDRKRKHL